MSANPVLVTVTRGALVESIHRGALLALNPDGSTLLSLGDTTAPFYPRSSAKPLQTLAMLRAGLDLGPDLLALACASHSGGAVHVEGVRRLLADAGLSPDALENVEGLPLGEQEHLAHLKGGGGPTQLLQNCSGKHAAMLATCVVNGWPTAGYTEQEHPLQRSILATMEELAGESCAAITVDGCGAPLFAWTYGGFARAFQTLVGADPDSQRVATAIRTHPDLLGGEGRDVTTLIRTVDGLVAKDGAEAVWALALPDGRTVVVKLDDGGARAMGAAAVEALRRCGVEDAELELVGRKPVLGHTRRVGQISGATDPQND